MHIFIAVLVALSTLLGHAYVVLMNQHAQKLFYRETKTVAYLVREKGHITEGIVNEHGDFVPLLEIEAKPHSRVSGHIINNHIDYECYELRTNTLIKGMIIIVDPNPEPTFAVVNPGYGVFVPELGSEIIKLNNIDDIDKYEVYNRPTLIKPSINNLLLTGSRPRKEYPPAPAPPGYRLVPFKEANPHDRDPADPAFARVAGNVMEFGTLSSQGEFVPYKHLPVIPRFNVPKHRSITDPDYLKRPFVYNIPRDGKKTEPVYEYRSGRLIKGTLHAYGNFEPEVGSRVIRFKDYTLPYGLRIYNLPGVIRAEE
jgi:hypothetical protein